MAWKDTKSILTRNFNRQGLTKAISAGMVCQQAEKLYPGLFKAVSLRNGILHLEINKEKQLAVKLIEGKLITDLLAYSHGHSLPVARRIRLTFLSESGTL